MWNLWQPYLHRMDETTIERRMHLAVNHLDKARIGIQAPMPMSVQQAKPHNKERSYKKFLQGISSEKWVDKLQLQAHNPGSRLRTYVFLHLDDTRRMQLYKPAPYLSLCTAAFSRHTNSISSGSALKDALTLYHHICTMSNILPVHCMTKGIALNASHRKSLVM